MSGEIPIIVNIPTYSDQDNENKLKYCFDIIYYKYKKINDDLISYGDKIEQYYKIVEALNTRITKLTFLLSDNFFDTRSEQIDLMFKANIPLFYEHDNNIKLENIKTELKNIKSRGIKLEGIKNLIPLEYNDIKIIEKLIIQIDEYKKVHKTNDISEEIKELINQINNYILKKKRINDISIKIEEIEEEKRKLEEEIEEKKRKLEEEKRKLEEENKEEKRKLEEENKEKIMNKNPEIEELNGLNLEPIDSLIIGGNKYNKYTLKELKQIALDNKIKITKMDIISNEELHKKLKDKDITINKKIKLEDFKRILKENNIQITKKVNLTKQELIKKLINK
jgi:hypothetical protein